MYGAHIQGMASISAAASTSITLAAAVTGSRIHIKTIDVMVLTPKVTAGGWLSISETDVGGTVTASVKWKVPIGSSNDLVHHFDFGEKGYAASAIGSRLIISENSDATVHAVFTGYAR